MKHLYKSSSNRVLSGICGGLGKYLGIDPVVIRLVWIFVVVMTGIFPGIIVYIIAYFVIPEEK